MPQKKPEENKKSSSWLEFAENGIDAAILIEGTVSELLAIKEHTSQSLDVIYYGMLRGAQKAREEIASANRPTINGLAADARKLESLTEQSLKEMHTTVWDNTKDQFQKTYKTKKDTIKEINRTTTDIPKLILSYDVASYNVLASVVQKHLNDPKSSKEKKKNIQKLSDALDDIRAGTQTLAAEQLSKLSLVSEKIGALLCLSLNNLVQSPNSTMKGLATGEMLFTKIKKTLEGIIYDRKYSALLPTMNQSDAHKFMLAGIYDGIKTQKEQPKKKRKPNAQKRHNAKLARKETKRIYNTYNPSVIDVLKHKSGWNEWRKAYDTVVRTYEKTDERVEQGMDTLLKQITAKSTSQEDLEDRRIIRQSEVGKKALSYYDQIRSISTASGMWLQANLYRASHHFGTALKQGTEWLSDDVPSKLSQDQDFQEALEGMKSVKHGRKQQNRKAKHKKKGRSR